MSKIVDFKKIDSMELERRILITHTDLDGVGCAVVYAKCFPQVEVHFVGYDEVNDLIPEVLDGVPINVPVMISDMSVSEELAEALEVRGNVELVDHHPTATWLQEKYHWAVVDTSMCATKLLYLIMSRAFVLSDYFEFTELVNNYDLWGGGAGPTEHAKDLSRLVFILGQERFFQRFATQSTVEFSPTEEAIIALDREHELAYIQESIPLVSILKDPESEYQYGLLPADQYVSVLGMELLKVIPGIEYIMLIDFRKDKASLRGRGNVDIGLLAKKVGGGGHRKAAGFPLSGAASRMFLNCNGSCEVTQELRKILSEVCSEEVNVLPSRTVPVPEAEDLEGEMMMKLSKDLVPEGDGDPENV